MRVRACVRACVRLCDINRSSWRASHLSTHDPALLVTPAFVSDAARLAPEEVLAGSRGALVGENERTATDKSRHRRAKKKVQGQERREREAREEKRARENVCWCEPCCPCPMLRARGVDRLETFLNRPPPPPPSRARSARRTPCASSNPTFAREPWFVAPRGWMREPNSLSLRVTVVVCDGRPLTSSLSSFQKAKIMASTGPAEELRSSAKFFQRLAERAGEPRSAGAAKGASADGPAPRSASSLIL